jgi:hypothetical protein
MPTNKLLDSANIVPSPSSATGSGVVEDLADQAGRASLEVIKATIGYDLQIHGDSDFPTVAGGKQASIAHFAAV